MRQTATRLLNLLALLQTRRHWSGPELRERLGVDARTVRRDIERLRELGYPVHASSGPGGGYQLGAGAGMAPLMLDDDEAVAMALALHAASGSVGGMKHASVGLLAKLEQLMPARLRKRVGALDAVVLTMPGGDAPASSHILAILAACCRDRTRCVLRYEDRQARASSRLVEPVHLAHTGRRWYLVAWDLKREDWRTFRVDRIRDAACDDIRYTPRPLPEDATTFVSRALSQAPYPYQVKVRLRGSYQALKPAVPSWAGVLEVLDEHNCALSTGAPTIDMLAAQLLLIGKNFEFIDPPAFAPLLRDAAARLQEALG